MFPVFPGRLQVLRGKDPAFINVEREMSFRAHGSVSIYVMLSSTRSRGYKGGRVRGGVGGGGKVQNIGGGGGGGQTFHWL